MLRYLKDPKTAVNEGFCNCSVAATTLGITPKQTKVLFELLKYHYLNAHNDAEKFVIGDFEFPNPKTNLACMYIDKHHGALGELYIKKEAVDSLKPLVENVKNMPALFQQGISENYVGYYHARHQDIFGVKLNAFDPSEWNSFDESLAPTRRACLQTFFDRKPDTSDLVVAGQVIPAHQLGFEWAHDGKLTFLYHRDSREAMRSIIPPKEFEFAIPRRPKNNTKPSPVAAEWQNIPESLTTLGFNSKLQTSILFNLKNAMKNMESAYVPKPLVCEIEVAGKKHSLQLTSNMIKKSDRDPMTIIISSDGRKTLAEFKQRIDSVQTGDHVTRAATVIANDPRPFRR